MEIVNASEGDAPALGELVADSLGHLPLARWLVTDPDDWEKIAPRYFESEIRDAVATGVVYTFADLSGAVVVFDHRDKHEPAPERES